MCGIVCIFSLGTSPIKDESIRKGLDQLYHRGPDHSSYWLSPQKDVALGHTRLSIIDLTTGNQPLSNANDTIRLVANGEFYDFEVIRERLIEKGYQFKTHSDSEIALHLYSEYGAGCFKHLRGEFAFSLWDNNNQLFISARDRLGIKPLFYAVSDGKLYVASEIKALLAAGVPAVWDQESYVTRAFFFRDRTLFKNICQVPPGHYLIATRSGYRILKYWDFDYPKLGSEDSGVDETSAIELVRDSLVDAVSTRLRADVPIAVYLSGGMDSSAVLGIAAEKHTQAIDSFTLSFDDASYNETETAKRTADAFGARHHVVDITADALADNFSRSIWHTETVCFNAHSVAKFILSKAVRDKGFKVVLTGEGADEIFGGYSAFRRDMILYNSEGQDPNYVAEYLKQLASTNQTTSGLLTPLGRPENIEFLKKILGFEPTYLLPLAETIDTLQSVFNAATSSTSKNLHPIFQFLAHTDLNSQIDNIEPVHASMYLISKSALPNYVMPNLGDRMEMAHSLEGRLPFLDHKLIEQVTKLPVSLKIRGTKEKFILREAVKPYILNEVYTREKQPFLAPPSTKQTGQRLHQLVQDTLRSPLLDALPFFDRDKVTSFLDKLPGLSASRQLASEAILMEMTCLCFLQQHFALTTK